MNRLITILFLGITTIIMQAKTDKEQIETLYRDMYEAMVAKDTVVLNRVHADDFVLTHMTGMHQSKQEYIKYANLSAGSHLYAFQRNGYHHRQLFVIDTIL